MKQYTMIETKTQMMFVVKGINANDGIKQVRHQLADSNANMFIVSSKRIH